MLVGQRPAFGIVHQLTGNAAGTRGTQGITLAVEPVHFLIDPLDLRLDAIPLGGRRVGVRQRQRPYQ